jgi:crossover junction endodeoxyribonuclease RuvC
MAVIIAGIDPGKTGAMVILFDDDAGLVFPVPLVKLPKETPAWSEWASTWGNALAFTPPDLIVIELVGARPGQGVTSMFTFGKSYGFAHALAAAVGCRIEFVTPATWKGKMGLAKAADKNASRERVRNTLPKLAHAVTRAKDDGVAEAALLALYGRRHLA